jgi:hypothetical protein
MFTNLAFVNEGSTQIFPDLHPPTPSTSVKPAGSIKLAHREVYLLTPAEELTRSYSNRFAAHILKQHQLHALCAARGWKNKLRWMVDDEYPPASRPLPQWGLRAEFWIEGAGDNYGTDTNESGAYRQIRR